GSGALGGMSGATDDGSYRKKKIVGSGKNRRPRDHSPSVEDVRRFRGLPPAPSRTDDRALLRWRPAQLVEAGFDEVSARRLATETDGDLHEMMATQDDPRCPTER